MLSIVLTLSALAGEAVQVQPFTASDQDAGLAAALTSWVAADLTHRLPDHSVSHPYRTPDGAGDATAVLARVGGTVSRSEGSLTLVVTIDGAQVASVHDAPSRFQAIEDEATRSIAQRLGSSAAQLPPPTSDLQALEAWGDGLVARHLGHTEHALRAFEQASTRDAGFAWAASDRLEAAAALPQHPRRAAHDAIYERYPALAGPPTSQADLTGFALRLMALEGDALHCQRASEMLRYLDGVGYRVAMPSGTTDASLTAAVALAAREVGLSPALRSEPGQAEAAYAMPQRRAAGQFLTSADFLMREGMARDTLGSGLFGSIARCHAPETAQEVLALVAAKTLQAGLGGELQQGRPAPAWTLRESLELAWAMLQAERGTSPEFERRLDLLVAGRPPADPLHAQLEARAQSLRTAARLEPRGGGEP